jgi:uncharacterized membrane protein YhfC
MATATPELKSQKASDTRSTSAEPQKLWTAGRLGSIILLALVPVAVMLFQPASGILRLAMVVEVVLAVITVTEWVPRQTRRVS